MPVIIIIKLAIAYFKVPYNVSTVYIVHSQLQHMFILMRFKII